MSGRLRWKRNPRETGLMAVGAGPRGWTLHDGETSFATVNALGGDWSRKFQGWYWAASGKVPYQNTCGTPVPTPEEAKDAALAYVKAHLSKATGAAP